jgi:hypothetical protein
MPDVKIKKTLVFILLFILVYLAGFFSRHIFDGNRVSRADEYRQNIEAELGTTAEYYNRIEGNINGARGGVTAGIELSGTIGRGLDGIENLAVENTELLGRAERILQSVGERKQQSQE